MRNGCEVLGVRRLCVQKAASKHLPTLFPFVPHVAGLPTPEMEPWLHLVPAAGCALQNGAAEDQFGRSYYSGWACSVRGR